MTVSNFRFFDLFATGMAIFAMFFGAGNIIFPLGLGYQTLEQTPYATLGLCLTAVLVPLSGLLAMFLYSGSIKSFFARLGEWPGFITALFIISLLGPLGSTPRCIALAYSTLKLSHPELSPLLFNFIACACLFLMTYKKRYLLAVLSYILTPLLLFLLTFIVIKGLWFTPELAVTETYINSRAAFWKGIQEGYNTMDLLAAFFFAPVIMQITKRKTAELKTPNMRLLFVIIASVIGATLLATVYLGFSLLSAKYAYLLKGVSTEDLLGTITLHLLGNDAGWIVSLTVILACLTTAVALITAFSEFIFKNVCDYRISYVKILFCSVFFTFVIANFEFQGISHFLTPILTLIYPFLILLTVYNLFEKFYLNKSPFLTEHCCSLKAKDI